MIVPTTVTMMNIPLFISRTNVAKQTRGKGNDESRSFFCTITERIFRLFVILCSLFAKRAEILLLFLKKSIAFWEKTWYNNHRQRGGLRFVAWHGGIAQLVRAFAWRAKGPEFESLYLHHIETQVLIPYLSFFFVKNPMLRKGNKITLCSRI